MQGGRVRNWRRCPHFSFLHLGKRPLQQSLTFQDLKAGGLATVLVAWSVELPTKVGSAQLARVPFSASAKGGGKQF